MESTGSNVSDLLQSAVPRKHRRPNPSPIAKLGDDLVVEILIRLPNPRYTCRCKSVSKRWRSLISDPCFNRRLLSHHQSSTEPPPLFLPSYDPQSVIRSFLPVPDEEIGRRLTVWDTNRDLVLCGFSDLHRDNSELPRSYLVCNPFTKKWIALPLAPQKEEGYNAPVTRLVCEPRISHNLELGDDQVYVHCPEYRFRVVCLYGYEDLQFNKVDVFCSESGKWTSKVLIIDRAFGLFHPNVMSRDGELWLTCFKLGGVDGDEAVIVSFNAFRLDKPPTIHREASAVFSNSWNLSITQGALHLIHIKETPDYSAVWRLEDDRKSWRCEGWFITSSGYCDRKDKYRLQIHPEKPEIIFIQDDTCIYSCDLSTGDLEFVCAQNDDLPYWKAHQLKVSCWPTSITRYEELRVAYDGSYSCWTRRSRNEERVINRLHLYILTNLI